MAESEKDDRSVSGGSDEPAAQRVRIGRLPLDPVTLDQAVFWTLNYIENRGERAPARISCPNASIVALASQDEDFAKIVATSNLVVADGMPLLWAATLFGTPLPGQVRGVDLMEGICAAGSVRGLSVYILGGLPGAADLAGDRLLRAYPGLQLAGTDCPALGFESDTESTAQVHERILASSPDFLIVALGSPKQERWMSRNYHDLPVGAILGVGGAVDTYSRLRPRPPLWMRKIGLEWLGRLLREPRRLWRRYLFGNSRFVWVVLRQRLYRGADKEAPPWK